MTLRLGGDGAITGCTSLENPDLTVSGLTISGSFDAEKVLVASGTAAAPSYTFSGDTDNGLYYAGTNSIGLSTAGTNAILIDSSGNVGVGITPTTRFHVYQTGSTQAGLIETSQSASVLNFKSTGQSSGQPQLGCAASDMILNTNGSERLRIDSSGRLGIGTSSPSTLLHVSGGDITANQNLLIRGSDSNGVFIRNGANTALSLIHI